MDNNLQDKIRGSLIGGAAGGVKQGVNGIEWTVFQVDGDLTDDNTAVFSNVLDGDGTVEVCDWISDAEQRVVLRENY